MIGSIFTLLKLLKSHSDTIFLTYIVPMESGEKADKIKREIVKTHNILTYFTYLIISIYFNTIPINQCNKRFFMIFTVFSKLKNNQTHPTISNDSPTIVHKRKAPNNKGQALVEYVLILTVVVVVMGGLLLKLNKGFERWGKSIIGTDGYIACLMQTGRLPGQSTTHLSNPCASISNIDFSYQGTSSGSSGSGSSSSGGSSSSSSSSSSSGGSSSSSGGGGENPDGKDTSHTSSDSSSSQDNTGSSNKKNRRSKKSKRGSSDSSGQYISVNDSNMLDDDLNKKNNNAGETGRRLSRRKKKKMGFRDGLTASNSKPGHSGRRFRAVGSYGYMLSDQEEQERRNIPISLSGEGSKKQNPLQKEKRSHLIKKENLKSSGDEAKITPWSFGNVFRIVLIILIIGVVLFLIISQTTQVKKSMK